MGYWLHVYAKSVECVHVESVECAPFFISYQHSNFKQGDGKSNYENRPGGNPAADYSEGASHVLAVIHQILNHHRTLEQKWHAKKIKLHQRLALRLFQEDVKQV